MAVVVAMMVVMIIFQHERAEEVHEQSNDRNDDGFAEVNRLWRQQAMYGVGGDKDGNDGQDHRTGEGAQDPDFAGAEGEARVFGVATAVGIGQSGEDKRGDVGSHVPAISHQGHGMEKISGHNFHQHHSAGQSDHFAGPFFGGRGIAGKIMFVLPD